MNSKTFIQYISIYLFNDAASTAVDFDYRCEYVCESELSSSSLATVKLLFALRNPIKSHIEIIRPPDRK